MEQEGKRNDIRMELSSLVNPEYATVAVPLEANCLTLYNTDSL